MWAGLIPAHGFWAESSPAQQWWARSDQQKNINIFNIL